MQRVTQLLRHPEHSFAIASIDRAVVNPDIAKRVTFTKGKLSTDRILECKTANGYATKEWGEEGTDEVPESYYCQCQWYLGVTGARYADLAVLIGGQDFRMYQLVRDDALIEQMLAIAGRFWQHVLNHTPPAPDTPQEALRLFPKSTAGAVIEGGAEALHCCTRLQELHTRIKTLEEEARQYRTRIMTTMGCAEVLKVNGHKIASWNDRERTSLDVKRLKEELPETYARYVRTTTSRVLRLYA